MKYYNRTEKTKREKKEEEKQDSWKDCIYNPRTGEFLGRTAGSWVFLLRMFPCHIPPPTSASPKTSSSCSPHPTPPSDAVPSPPQRPLQPGLKMISPNCRTCRLCFCSDIQASFCLSSSSGYNDSIQERNDLCMVGEYTTQDNEPVKKVCQFKRSTLRQCSGLPDPSFGFKEGKPCIIIKLNRVIGLKPEGDPYINCTAKRATSLQMQYFPSEGRLDKMFFPYYGKKSHPDYVQPLVAVKLLFTKEDYNIEQTVECKVEGSNLRNDDERDKFLGRVTFRVKVSE
uniref:Sodium/potassium-transporting ATPase subunit beta-3 n=1 Tax=Neolamprologus brichardi TaxID=32507 RepID=A0A3Q4GLR2_NEOBR